MGDAESQSLRSRLIALSAQADPVAGFFGPESISWRVNREALLLAGGLRALLLQVAHPKVAQGVVDHSHFRDAPLARARRTFDTVHGMVFGTPEAAIDRALALHDVHRSVRGQLPDPLSCFSDQTYHANDPDLLLWVFATLMDSAVLTYESIFNRLNADEKEAFYREGKRFAQLCGLEESLLPCSWTDFSAWFAQALDSPMIRVTRPAIDIKQSLLNGTLGLRLVSPVTTVLAAGYMNTRLRQEYGLPWNAATRGGFYAVRATLRIARHVLPPAIRWMPVARAAYRRCR